MSVASAVTSTTGLAHVPLVDLVEFRRGLTYRKADEVAHSSNAVLRANNVDLSSGSLDLSDIRFISDEIEVPENKRIVPESLLICTASGSRSHLGKVAYIESETGYAFGGFMGLLVPKEHVTAKYLYYFFRSDAYQEFLASLSSGANINNLRFADLGKLLVPVPTEVEQKRIVSILDQAVAALDRARAHAEANLANADDLFLQMASESLDQIVRASGTAPVGEVADHCLGKMLDKKKNKGALRPYLRNLNVRWFNVDTSDVLEMRIEEHEAERYEVRKGDLLICEGGYPGRAAIYDSDDTIYFQKALHRVRFNDPNLSKVLMYWLYVEDQLGRLKTHFSGTGISHFTGRALAAYQMPVAAENVTSDVVSRIDRCWADTRKLVRAYEAKLADIAALRKSLLQQAFSGQLT